METKENIEELIRNLGEIPSSNYFIAEKSWRPTLQLRGSGAYLWEYFSRKSYLLIFTKDQLILYDLVKQSLDGITYIPFDKMIDFSVEKLTPFPEYCLSFKYNKMYYFYIESDQTCLERTFNTEQDFSIFITY